MVPSENQEEESQVSVNGKRSKPEDAGGEGEYHPAKLSRRDLYKPPTAEELNQLKEAESLFHCSLLKMQVRPPERRHGDKKEDISDPRVQIKSLRSLAHNRWKSC